MFRFPRDVLNMLVLLLFYLQAISEYPLDYPFGTGIIGENEDTKEDLYVNDRKLWIVSKKQL